MQPVYFQETGFLRKVKKTIKAREHCFLLKVPPFFSAVAAAELAKKGISASIPPVQTDAGILVTGPVELVYAMHLKLQVPSRIMLRISEFRSGAVEELYKKAIALTWELYINPRIPLRISCRVRHSRIEHEGAAATTLFQAIAARFAAAPYRERICSCNTGGPHTGTVQRISLVIEENRASLYADCSGEHLHKRGYRKYTGEAPIRETLAAGFLYRVMDRIRRQPDCILDPMCGSGTFPAEWSLMTSPAGIHGKEQLRPFLFESLPWHRSAAWEYEKRQPLTTAYAPVRIFASDSDDKAVATALGNYRTAFPSQEASFCRKDFFASTAADYENIEHGLIVSNLPYGIRKKEGGPDFARTFVDHARRAFPGWDIAFVCPEKSRLEKPADAFSFFSGGIRVKGVFFNAKRL